MSSTSRSAYASEGLSTPTPLAALVVSVVSPLVLSAAFPKLDIGVLSLFALAPLFWLWSVSSWKSAFRWGWLSGTIYFFVMFFWMTNSLGDYIGQWKLLAGLLLAIIEGLAFAAVALATKAASRGTFGALAIFATSGAWLIAESIRTRGSLGVPFGQLGLAAAHMPWLLPLAAFGGVFGLTAVIALCNACVTALAAGTVRAKRTAVVTLAVLAALVVAGDIARARVIVPPPTLHVAIAQGNISQRDKWSPAIFEHTMAVYSGLTQTAAQRGAAVVIWPETAITSYPLQDPSLLAYLERLAASNKVWLLAGTVDRPQKTTLFNAVIAITPSGTLAGEYQKHILVPFAEYLPADRYLRDLPLFSEASMFVQGPGPALLRGGGMAFGVLVCYESAFAPYAREIANAGAQALAIVTDDAWFGHTSGPYQHAEMAIVDAVETGRWVVRGADTGISEIIDPKGVVVARLDLDQQGVIDARIGAPVQTPYLRFGVAWLLVLSVIVLAFAFVPRSHEAGGWRSRRGRA